MVARRLLGAAVSAAVATVVAPAFAQVKGPSTTQDPYVIPTAPGVVTVSLISNGPVTAIGQVKDETYNLLGGPAGSTYRMAGIPDGLGAYDNGNGTFTVLMNHEIASGGAVREHGSNGAFVSQWVLNKNVNNLAVFGGRDLSNNVAAVPGGAGPFSRFCSADLPAPTAFYNPATNLGTPERIFMNGEETGAEGRAFAHIIGSRTTQYLPALGKFSWENSVANPFAQNRTIVAGTDDATTDGQVYFYVGNKQATGSAVERAGLTNGNLFGIKLTGALAGLSQETRGGGLSSNAPGVVTSSSFVLQDLGNVAAKSGATLNTESNTAGVMRFLRPEDGAWNPANPSQFFFVTTDTVTASGGRSRLYRASFNDITNPAAGGTIDMLLSGTEGQEMLDNMTIVQGKDGKTRVLLQEDVGNNARLGKIWMYTVEDNTMLEVAAHDPKFFQTGGANFLTQDEESSGIIPAFDILGDGWFLMDVQAHYGLPDNGLVEGGQLLAVYIPQAVPEPTTIAGLGLAGLAALRRRRSR
jgi:hypothetical protein